MARGASSADTMLRRFGITTDFYDPGVDEAGMAALIRPETRVVYTESPGSHTFEVQDVPAIARAAHARGAKVLMDNTWGLHFFQPFRHGVDVSIQALTKYAGGHSDVLLGSITTNSDEDWERVHAGVRVLGQYASPDDCWLALRGMRTLGVRLQTQMEAGIEVAHWLRGRPEVAASAAPGAARRARPRVVEARLHRREQPVRRGAQARVQRRREPRDGRCPEPVRHRRVLGRLREPAGSDHRQLHPHRRRRARHGGRHCACTSVWKTRPI